ncbi:MAG: DNA-processing protein DprA [Candidatus Hatepunaea meridiana]|nr:DNA-processing protein DprA [Candidatus Hatepunaea meridiana]
MKIFTDNSFQWFNLFCAKGFGPKKLHSIYDVLRNTDITIDELFCINWSEFQHILPGVNQKLFDSLHELDGEEVERTYNQIIEADVYIIHLGHPEYPEILIRNMNNSAPPLLFCKGNSGLINSDSISIVGSRRASPEGLELAGQLAADLANDGKNIISGYAKGIDTAAHKSALEIGGTTTIVMSSGILKPQNRNDLDEFIWNDNTLIISQFHPYSNWSGSNAMIRNKLVCALSEAVIVIEAGEEVDDRGKMSGTFNTGKTALNMGVPVIVVSPEYFDCQPSGNRKLIRMGAFEQFPGDEITSLIDDLKNRIITSEEPERLPQLSII